MREKAGKIIAKIGGIKKTKTIKEVRKIITKVGRIKKEE